MLAAFILLLSALGVSQLKAQSIPQSYTVMLPTGMSLIANQLDHGSNTADVVFPNPTGSRDFDELIFNYNCADGSSTTIIFDSVMPTGFGDANDTTAVDPPVLAPGEGFFYVNNNLATSNTFTGTPHVPVLPAALACGYGATYLLSRQTNDPGTYENITGLAPQDGAEVQVWNGAGFVTNRFAGGGWTLGVSVLSIGQAARFYIPPPGYTLDLAGNGNGNYYLIANQLDHGSNRLDEVLANLPVCSSCGDLLTLSKFNCTGWSSTAQYYDPVDTGGVPGWYDNLGNPSALTLAPGGGALV